MNNSEQPKRHRRRSALADADDNSNDLLRRERPAEEATEPASLDDKTKNLHRKALAIASRYGNSIGQNAMYVATKAFQPKRDSFDLDGTLSVEAARELLRLMGKAVPYNFGGGWSLCKDMTKKQLNTMRKAQGLPPV